jgi:hypothetical protein
MLKCTFTFHLNLNAMAILFMLIKITNGGENTMTVRVVTGKVMLSTNMLFETGRTSRTNTAMRTLEW